MLKGYAGMELLEALLSALVVVLAAVVALAAVVVVVVVVVVVQNKQGQTFKGFYLEAFSLSCGTCLKGMQA